MKLHFAADYDGLVKRLLFSNQFFEQDLYFNDNGMPLIGYHFNLKNDVVLEPILCAIGFDVHGKFLDRSAWLAETHYINRIKHALNNTSTHAPCTAQESIREILSTRHTDARYSKFAEFHRATTFSVSANRVMPYLQAMLENAENRVDEWLTSFDPALVQANFLLIARNTRERAVLVSLAYQGVIGFDSEHNPLFTELADALLNNNRALTWYHIRYNKNVFAYNTAETIKRRYLESELFGLYDDGVNEITITREKCRQIYDMFNEHKDDIMQHERVYSGFIAQQSENYRQFGIAAVKSLEQSFRIAYEFVRATARLKSNLHRAPTLMDRVQEKEQGWQMILN